MEEWLRRDSHSFPLLKLGSIMAEILANLEDINANLDGDVVVATDDNTIAIQVSVARIVRGYLSRVIDTATLVGWDTPTDTPDIIREAAGKLIAAQLYFNSVARTSLELPTEHISQLLYNQGMAILNNIVAGTTTIPNVTIISTESMSVADFFPIDNTDQSFTKSQRLD